MQGMTAAYGNFDRDAQEQESLKTIAVALDLGINMLDTAWIYMVLPSHLYVLFLTKFTYSIKCIDLGP